MTDSLNEQSSGEGIGAQPQQREKRQWLVPAALGVVVGCLVGGLAVAGFSNPGIFTGGPDFAGVVDECEVSAEGYALLDDGESLALNGKGEDYSDTGTDYAEIACVLLALDVPGSVISKIDSTRALDGRQSDSWDDVAISWSYHPDSGVGILLEKER